MLDGLFSNPLHWIIALVVVLILFGPGKLPQAGSALGKSIREFRKSVSDETPENTTVSQPQLPALTASGYQGQTPAAPPAYTPASGPAPAAGPRSCGRCGTPAGGPGFCARCGSYVD